MMKHSVKRYLNDFFRDMTGLGSGYIIGGLGLIFILIGQMDNFWRIVFILISTYLVAAIIRQFYFKDRPRKEQYSNFLDKIDASSFPSVHAARAVAVCSLITGVFTEITYLVWLVCALILYSRIYLKKHDYIDVLGGIVLGLILFWVMGMIL